MTPAIIAAEKAGIVFSLHRYDHDANAEAFGLEAAEKLGVAPERMFKTLIAQLDGKQLVMVLVPVAARLDLKKLAVLLQGKKADLAPPAAAERATGYVIGGISPLGGKKQLPVFIDITVADHSTVFVSAGQRGLQMELSPEDLVRLTSATTAALTTAQQ
jgi:Cys-tRNA(Pro)/Cys-tRNA(Cys) deacylase